MKCAHIWDVSLPGMACGPVPGFFAGGFPAADDMYVLLQARGYSSGRRPVCLIADTLSLEPRRSGT